MKASNISRVCLVNTLMLGLVIAYSLWSPGKMNIAMAERHVGAHCEGDCLGDRSTGCSDNGDGDNYFCPSTVTYSECYGDGTMNEHFSDGACSHDECEDEYDCSCYN